MKNSKLGDTRVLDNCTHKRTRVQVRQSSSLREEKPKTYFFQFPNIILSEHVRVACWDSGFKVNFSLPVSLSFSADCDVDSTVESMDRYKRRFMASWRARPGGNNLLSFTTCGYPLIFAILLLPSKDI